MTALAERSEYRSHYLGLTTLLCLLLGFSCAVLAVETNPLRPADTTSPRATLQGFIEATDQLYLGMKEVLEDYGRSDRLYLTPAERKKQGEMLRNASKIVRFLDVSEISPVLRETVAAERLLQLKEILDRIEVPSFADIPDRQAMVQSGAKRWRLPGTEIDLVLIENGPRAGEYLVSAETVDRLPEFYEQVKDLALQA